MADEGPSAGANLPTPIPVPPTHLAVLRRLVAALAPTGIVWALTEFHGGTIGTMVNLCEHARTDAYLTTLEHAAQLGANAIIGFSYDTTEVYQGMTEVLAYGTAVVVEPESAGSSGKDRGYPCRRGSHIVRWRYGEQHGAQEVPMARLTIVGNVNLETTVRVEGFPVPYQPTTFAPFGVSSAVSGVGYNLARALATLGDTVAFASLVGDDAAANLVRAALATDGIADDFVLGAAVATAQSVVLYDGSGARAVHTDLKDVLGRTYPPDRFAAALAGSELAVLTNIAYNKPLLAVAQERNVPIATDLHTLTDLDDAYNAPFLRSAHILFVSGERIRVPPATWAEAILVASPAEVVVVGLGAQGAYLAVRSSGLRQQLPAVYTRPVVQTGGAGDALFACFLHGYQRTYDPLRSLRAATVFASYKLGAANSGDGFLTHDGLETLLASSPETA